MHLPIRKSPRWSEYDYSSEWFYFITIVTKNREQYFGEIIDAKMVFSSLWKICEQEILHIWNRKSVDIHEFVVMPNHIHIIIGISNYPVGADHKSARNDNDQSAFSNDQSVRIPVWNHIGDFINPGDLMNRPYMGPTLSSIIKLFKWNISKFAESHNIPFARQRSFHDHIIRNTVEYDRIKYYI
jgi:hypothetical protein